MSADGVDVRDVATVVDHGPFAALFGLAIVGDGFTDDELGVFQAAVEELVAFLQGVQPFADKWEAMSVTRIDVVSRDSGMARGAEHHTAFGARPEAFPRTLKLDWVAAEDVADRHAPGWLGVLVVVNDGEQRGCATPTVAVTTLQPEWLRVAVHELGHQPFGLEDEYARPKRRFAGTEPGAPNVTAKMEREGLKWSDLVDESTSVPTQPNPECEPIEHWTSPVAEGTVGVFEGAGTYRCGLARSEFSCLMRSVTAERFCKVCTEIIATQLSNAATMART